LRGEIKSGAFVAHQAHKHAFGLKMQNHVGLMNSSGCADVEG
jgi:hypothetical protein